MSPKRPTRQPERPAAYLLPVMLDGSAGARLPIARVSEAHAPYTFIHLSFDADMRLKLVNTTDLGRIVSIGIRRKPDERAFVVTNDQQMEFELMLGAATSADLDTLYFDVDAVHKGDMLLTYGRSAFPDGLRHIQRFDILHEA